MTHMNGYCVSCRKGQHQDCDNHMNDGAVDALDFVNVYCACEHTDEQYWGEPAIDVPDPRPWTIREKQLAGLLSTQAPFSSQHPENALPLARFLMDDDAAGDLLGVERL